ncbi:MAG: hypothetical protein IJG63_00865 [Oscillospiraceae bacterium]|nr:hypothetical protein [Oscillospiraceae bacterium]
MKLPFEIKMPDLSENRNIIIIAAACLLVIILLVVLIATGAISFGGQRDADAGPDTDRKGDTVFYYETGSRAVFGDLNGRLMVASSLGASFYNRDGSEVFTSVRPMDWPVLSTGGGKAAVWETGGDKFMTVDSGGIDMDMKTESPVITASLNEKGWLCLCTEDSAYYGVVTVYNDKGVAEYKWYSGNGYLMNAKLADNCKDMAVLTLNTEGSAIVYYKLDSEEEQARFELDGELIIDICYTSAGDLAVLSNNCLRILSGDTLKAKFDFPSQHLGAYAFADGYTVIFCNESQFGNGGSLITLNDSCEVIGLVELGKNVDVIATCGSRVATLSADVVTEYNRALDQKDCYETDTGTISIIVGSDKSVLALGKYSAERF